MAERQVIAGGVYAAVLTPRTAGGALDEAAFAGLLEFLLGKGISGFAVNGATGEFCLTSETEFARLMRVAVEVTKGRGSFLAGIGAASSDAAVRLGKIAAGAGAAGLLLPMPYFFPYSQGDMKAFCRSVAAEVDAPILLYNLPQFTTGLDAATSLELIRECENIVGIKESSGSLETLQTLTDECAGALRLIGNDEVLGKALEERVLDGVVSGVACVLPELIQRLYAVGTSQPGGAEFVELEVLLKAFIEQIGAFPTPWGLKMIAEARGVAKAAYPFPLSQERELQRGNTLRWFAEKRAQLLAQ